MATGAPVLEAHGWLSIVPATGAPVPEAHGGLPIVLVPMHWYSSSRRNTLGASAYALTNSSCCVAAISGALPGDF